MNWILDCIFDDAHRRVCIAKQRNEKDRSRIWTGLSMPSRIRMATKAGYMRPACGSAETPRVLNWYTFTPDGWSEYDRRYKGKPDWFEVNK